MKKLAFAAGIIAALLIGEVAPCQPLQQIIADTPAAQHPGDIVAFTAWYGLRAYSAAKAAATVNIADLRRVSDNATCTVKAKANGDADVSTGTICNGNTQTVTAWIGASSATVSKLYDQVAGNACAGSSCDLVQATASHQPTFVLSCNGALPCLRSVGTTNVVNLGSANTFTPSGTAHSFAGVANRSSGTANGIFLTSNGVNIIQAISSANRWAMIGTVQLSSTIGVATDNAWHANTGVINNNPSTSVEAVDGTEATATNVSVSTAAGAPRMVETAQFATITLNVAEAGFVNSTAFSGETRTALCHNMRLYWSTGGSC